MYDRYKTGKNKKKWPKILIILTLLGSLIFLGFHFRNKLMFWKYTTYEIDNSIKSAIEISNPQEKEKSLLEILPICDEYLVDHSNSENSYLYYGKVYLALIEARLGKTFTEMIIFDEKVEDSKSQEYLILSIKKLKRGIALAGKNQVSDEYNLLYAKTLYYSGNYDLTDVKMAVEQIHDVANFSKIEDLRFLGYLMILENNYEIGLNFCEQTVKDDDFAGKLFLAKILYLSKRNTVALEMLRNSLDQVDNNFLLPEYFNLIGKIQFEQGLYTDAIASFSRGYECQQNFELLVNLVKTMIVCGRTKDLDGVFSNYEINSDTQQKINSVLQKEDFILF